MPEQKTGWEADKKKHFDEIAENYDMIRPRYPAKLFEDIIVICGAGKKAIEIGAGTGIATESFLRAGFDVTAIEIGEKMAGFMQDKLNSYGNLDIIVSSFEDANMPENSYDLVYAANSFHWIDPEIGCSKAFRLLKSGGAFALFRYNGVPLDGDEMYEEIQKIYEKHYRPFYPDSKRPVKDDYGNPEQLLYRFGVGDIGQYGFNGITMKLYDEMITYSADEYIALLDTLSDHRHLPDESRTALYAGVKEAILRYGGKYNAPHTFQLYMGRKG